MADNKEAEKIMYSYTSENNSALEDENRILRDTITRLKNELDRFREPALMVCEVNDIVKDKAIIKVPNGNMFFVNITSNLKELSAGDMVLCEQKNLTVIEKVHTSKTFNVEKFVIIEKPKLKWSDVGGLDEQAEEIKEVIELPLKT